MTAFTFSDVAFVRQPAGGGPTFAVTYQGQDNGTPPDFTKTPISLSIPFSGETGAQALVLISGRDRPFAAGWDVAINGVAATIVQSRSGTDGFALAGAFIGAATSGSTVEVVITPPSGGDDWGLDTVLSAHVYKVLGGVIRDVGLYIRPNAQAPMNPVEVNVVTGDIVIISAWSAPNVLVANNFNTYPAGFTEDSEVTDLVNAGGGGTWSHAVASRTAASTETPASYVVQGNDDSSSRGIYMAVSVRAS
jgi:hypothetical protein